MSVESRFDDFGCVCMGTFSNRHLDFAVADTTTTLLRGAPSHNIITSLDPRLMQESPEVLAVTQRLENPRVPYVVCGVVSIAPVISAVLAAFAVTETSVRVMSTGLVLVIFGSMSTFFVCARSLARVIDGSLERKREENAEKGAAGLPGGDNSTAGGDPNLLAARTKIRTVMIFGIAMSSTVSFTLLLAIVTKWGTAAPLLLFGIPLGKPAVCQ